MTEILTDDDQAALQRRRFLRGGALLAAAAGGAVAASVSTATPAAAATGENLVLGQGNVATTPTGLQADGAGAPTFQLTNAKGATLLLNPYEGELRDLASGVIVGAVVNTDSGPYIGLKDEDGTTYLGYLATGDDVAATPVTLPVDPTRIWDSKAKKGKVVARSSSGAVDSKGRLVKGAWVDVEVAGTDLDVTPVGAFLTLGSSGSSGDGYLSAYRPGSRPGTISASFLKGKTMSGSAFPELAQNGRSFVVRIYASQTTYVTVDLSALTSVGVPGPDFSGQAQARTATKVAATRQARRTVR